MRKNTNTILIVLLVGLAFFAGTMWMKAKTLGGGAKKQEVAKANPAPEQGGVLGAESLAKIETGGAGVKGEANAPVTIVEFSDFQCPFCKRYFDETYARIGQEYGNKIRYIFHDYPLPFHQNAQRVAEVARCAGDQGKFWEMHDLLFTKQDEWVPQAKIDQTVKNYAQKIGLDVNKFSACLNSGKFTQAVKDDFSLGASVGISGTPSFFINGKTLVGAQPFESFKALIDSALTK